jgi:hypothetical protein
MLAGLAQLFASEETIGSSVKAAEQELEAARVAFDEAEDDKLALEHLQASLEHCVLPAAVALRDHILQYGPGSVAMVAVTRALNAGSHAEVLGIDSGKVSPARLKKAYRRMCLELHPDRCHARGAVEAFQRVQQAYHALEADGGATRSVSARREARRQKSHEQQAAASRQRAKDRTWTSRGMDPRYGAPAPRGRTAPHLEPQPRRRANGRVVPPPKAGPPPR